MSQGTGGSLALAGALAIGAKSVYDHLTSSKHERLVKKTAKELDRNTISELNIKADHGIDVGSGRPDTINGYRPDITATHFDSSTFLAIEIETADSLESHAKAQLEAFAARPNYRAVLVVPSRVLPDAEQFVESRVDANVTVTVPGDVI